MAKTTRMPRRGFLKVLPAALAVPTLAQADTQSPIMKLFRKVRAISDAADAHIPLSVGKAVDDEYDRLFFDEMFRIEKEMLALPSTSAADFAAKMIIDTIRGTCLPDWKTSEVWAEARELTESAI